jgi:hypothetical protein
MTQDEIKEMAVQAGIRSATAEFYKEEFAALFKLVAAKEREACANLCESYVSESPYSWGGTTMSAAIRARGQA